MTHHRAAPMAVAMAVVVALVSPAANRAVAANLPSADAEEYARVTGVSLLEAEQR